MSCLIDLTRSTDVVDFVFYLFLIAECVSRIVLLLVLVLYYSIYYDG